MTGRFRWRLGTWALFFASVTLAAGLDTPPSYNRTSAPELEVVDWKGHVTCDGKGDEGEVCPLRFTREDGEEFSIALPGRLASLTWSEGTRRHIRLRAKRTPKFLFWGNELVVMDYWIIDGEEKETGGT